MPRSLHKNLSQPESISSTPTWLSAVSSAGVASVKALKAVFLPIPLICPHVSHPVKQWNPRSSEAFDVPRRTYIGFIRIFVLLSPVPISMVVWRPRTVSLWRTRTITSVSWAMICTLFPALESSAVYSMIRVSASSCVLTPVDGWTLFMLLFTCRRVTVTEYSAARLCLPGRMWANPQFHC